MKYKLNIHFVGTNFEGWQSQPSGNTVQDHIEKALQQCLGIRFTTGCSRTDSGVHARGLSLVLIQMSSTSLSGLNLFRHLFRVILEF